ncbi:MAG: hypothetical protein WC061_04625 [Melioribacteraceae bacterium]
MKKIFGSLLILLIAGSIIYSQNRPRMGNSAKPMQRIEQWEKMKLIEILDLNENTAVRFFARRHENQMKIKEILDKRDIIIRDLEEDVKNDTQRNDSFYLDQINKLTSLERKISSERENFVKSLGDLLSPQQIVKLIVFESNFRREVRASLMDRGGRKQNKE